jgi:hypothetical protein
VASSGHYLAINNPSLHHFVHITVIEALVSKWVTEAAEAYGLLLAE